MGGVCSTSTRLPPSVGVTEALANPSFQVRRLLNMAEKWPDQQDSSQPPTTQCRTARQLRPEEIDELVTAYTAGETVYELAHRTGIHRSTIGKHLRARGVDTTPPGLHPNDVPAAVELYRAGWTHVQIAEQFGVGQTTIRGLLHAAGVPKTEPYGRTGRNLR
jgi:hypothetical protein